MSEHNPWRILSLVLGLGGLPVVMICWAMATAHAGIWKTAQYVIDLVWIISTTAVVSRARKAEEAERNKK